MKSRSGLEPSALLAFVFVVIALINISSIQAQTSLPAPVEIANGWQLQDAAKVPQLIEAISSPDFTATGWYSAVVPGTVLTSLVKAGVYPEPLYAENNRPDRIPESLSRTNYWYRTTFTVPK